MFVCGKRWIPVAGLLLLGSGVLFAAPQSARAGDDFERGFKRELGRITAREAVRVGRDVVGGVILGRGHHGGGYYGRAPYYPRRHYRRHRGYDRPYRSYRSYGYRPRRVVHEHYYHGEPCDGPEVHEHHHYGGYDD